MAKQRPRVHPVPRKPHPSGRGGSGTEPAGFFPDATAVRPWYGVHVWVGLSVLLGTALYAIAEDLTLVTYYPSPRGVYNELRTRGNVQVGSVAAPADPATAPRLHVVQEGTAPALQVDDEAGDTTPLVIDADGNVGVGTTMPGATIDVYPSTSTGWGIHVLSTDGRAGDFETVDGLAFRALARGAGQAGIFQTIGSIGPAVSVSQSGSGPGMFVQSASGWAVDARAVTGTGVRAFSSSGTAGSFYSGSGPGLVVEQGNVGLGTTAPAQKLHVSGSGVGADIARIRVASTNNQAGIGFLSDNAGEVVVYSPDGTNDLRFWLGVDRLSVTPAGNVGIGTTVPQAKLSLGDDLASTKLALYQSGIDRYGIGVTAGRFILHLGNPGARFSFNNSAVGGSEVMSILGNGRVGIGTTNPLARLQVRTSGATVAGAFQNTTPGQTALTVQGRVLVNGDMSVIDGTFTATDKRFTINHPIDPQRKLLIHGTLEGPESAVFYRGEGALSDGAATIVLPDYFEALTRPEGRTVLVTPRFTADEPVSALAASAVEHGAFRVKAIDAANPAQTFSWEVKAIREDVPPLEIEVAKEGE